MPLLVFYLILYTSNLYLVGNITAKTPTFLSLYLERPKVYKLYETALYTTNEAFLWI